MLKNLPKPGECFLLSAPVMDIEGGTEVEVIGMSHIYGYNRFIEVQVADGTRALVKPTDLCHPS